MTGGTWNLGTTVALVASNLRSGAAAATSFSATQKAPQSLAYGTSSTAFGIVCDVSYTLGAGASVTYNLFDGSLTDVFGDAANFRRLKGFALWVSSGGDASGVTIAGGASNPNTLFFTGTTPGQTVYPSGPAASGGSPAGVAVTASACNIKVTNNSAVTATFTLLLVGTAAVPGVPMGLTLALTYP